MPLQIPLTEGKLIFLAKTFYLTKDKNDYFCRFQTYLFSSLWSWSYFKLDSYTVYLTGSLLTLTFSVLSFMEVFLVLGLHNKYF
jgi:hypothetical protein